MMNAVDDAMLDASRLFVGRGRQCVSRSNMYCTSWQWFTGNIYQVLREDDVISKMLRERERKKAIMMSVRLSIVH